MLLCILLACASPEPERVPHPPTEEEPVAEAPANARLRPSDDGLLLVLDMPTTKGLDAVSLPGGATRDLQVTTPDGEPVPVHSESFEHRMDGGRVVVELGAVDAETVRLAGTLEAHDRDGSVIRAWPLPATARGR